MTGLRWNEQQLADHLAKTGVAGVEPPRPDTSAAPFRMPSNAGRYALGRLPAGTMNKTETAYAAHLEQQRSSGAIDWFKFESMKFRLADNTFYTPDFILLTREGFLEAHEVKGFWEDDARVKIKVAASIYPIRFIAVTVKAKKLGGGWLVEEFSR